MVRFSKLPFRELCRRWGCNVVYSPMIMADSFDRSGRARDAELTTNDLDSPLVVQFACHEPTTFAIAAAAVARDCAMVDLNCGCPQHWVNSQGDGAALLVRPELVADMVREASSACGPFARPVSIKIRVRRDLRQTVELARRAQHAGAALIAVHGRLKDQRDREPADYAAIKLVRESVDVPVIANGGVFTLEQATSVLDATGACGVMSANGILRNPAMFLGYARTPYECARDWLRLSVQYGVEFGLAQMHLMHMMDAVHACRADRRAFNDLESYAGVYDWFEEHFPSADEKTLAMIDDAHTRWPAAVTAPSGVN
eukprot:m51a1_g3025 putative trna-dihydrouridine(20a 20b) synthase (314) ;mRNA; r:877448-878801